MIENFYWKLRYSLEKHYFEKKFSALPPKIYYDKKHNVYIAPKLIGERGCCEYVCSELASTGCIYHYYLGEEKQHCHAIAVVSMEAYNSEYFSIAVIDENEYSHQELNLIRKLVEQGKTDRQNYRNTVK